MLYINPSAPTFTPWTIPRGPAPTPSTTIAMATKHLTYHLIDISVGVVLDPLSDHDSSQIRTRVAGGRNRECAFELFAGLAVNGPRLGLAVLPAFATFAQTESFAQFSARLKEYGAPNEDDPRLTQGIKSGHGRGS
jgi:hypothetical protein